MYRYVVLRDLVGLDGVLVTRQPYDRLDKASACMRLGPFSNPILNATLCAKVLLSTCLE